jgi:hypothetical protein
MQRWNGLRAASPVALALVLGTCLVAISGAQAQGFETVEVTLIACRIVSDEMVMDDGAVHIRQRVLEAAVVSDDPYFAGEGTVISNADLFPAAGRGVLQGVIEIRPDAFDGFWSGSFAMVMDEDGHRGWTVSQGNGPDLQGLFVESVLRQLPPSVVTEYAWACDGEAPVSGSVATGTVARLRPDAEP